MWTVNARSENAEYAAALISAAIEKIAVKTAYTLRSDKTEAVENENFAGELRYQQRYLAELEAAVEKSVNKEAAQRRVEEQRAYIESGLDGQRFLVNPSAVQNYRSVIVPAMYTFPTTPYVFETAEEAERLEHQFLNGDISAQEFVKALDALNQ